MKTKKLALTLLALLIALSMLAACGGAPEESPAPEVSEAPVSEAPAPSEAPPNEEPAVTEEVPPSEEVPPEPSEDLGMFKTRSGDINLAETFEPVLPLTEENEGFTYWFGMYPFALSYITDYSTQSLVYSTLEEWTGVDVEFILVHPSQQSTQMNLMIASGDCYDVMCSAMGQYTGGVDKAIDDEVVLDLMDYIPQYAPNYWSKITYSMDAYDSATTAEGRIAAFCQLMARTEPLTSGLGVRQDYLDQAGLEVPTTVDGLYEMLLAFKDINPNTYMWVPTDASFEGDQICATLNAASAMRLTEEGKIAFGPIQSEFKDYLTLMNQWYNEGLIWPDFATYDSELRTMEDTDKMSDGTISVNFIETSRIAGWADATGITYVPMPDPVAKDGDVLHWGRLDSTYVDQPHAFITTNCDNPELVCSFFDVMYTEAGSLLCNWGVEGESFVYDEDGNPTFTDLILDNPDYDYMVAVNMYVAERGPFCLDTRRNELSYNDVQRTCNDVWSLNPNDHSLAIPTKATMNAAESEENAIIFSDIETYVQESVVKFVMGITPLDQFDDFVAQVESLNIARCVELQQAAYDRYMSEK